MSTSKITALTIIILIIGACGLSIKSTAPTALSNPPSSAAVVYTKPANGIYAPGSEELTAIKTQYSDVTLEKLKEGYTIYAEGACIKCHSAKNIYNRNEEQWKIVIEDMAIKANISDTEKDAVYKYIFAIKATEPK